MLRKTRLPILLAILTSGLAAQELGRAPGPEALGDAETISYRKRFFVPTVNVRDRAAVASFYQKEYKKSAGVPNGWSGSEQGCRAGENSPAYDEATLNRVNYYRAMAGLPADISLKPIFNESALKAALMMSANNSLNHNPPAAWKCYSAEGKKGAGHSNLSLGAAGPDAIDLYMFDPGSNNSEVGHRTWILTPGLAVIGTGSTRDANALYVIGDFRKDSQPVEQIAWPPAGYVPYQFGHSANYRWSFIKTGANLNGARVTVSQGGRALGTRIEHNSSGKVVWLVSLSGNQVETDTRYDIKIVAGGQTYAYPVVFINPDRAGAGTEHFGGAAETAVASGESSASSSAEPGPPEISPARQAVLDRALIGAVYRGRVSEARRALEQGASPNAKKGDWTALLLAAYYGRAEIVTALLERGADTAAQVNGFDAAAMAYGGGFTAIGQAIEQKTGTRGTRSRATGDRPMPP